MAGTCKPETSMVEASYTVNSYSVYDGATGLSKFFDQTLTTYPYGYFNSPNNHYMDITFNNDFNFWEHSHPDGAYANIYNIYRFQDGGWVNITDTIKQTALVVSTWSKTMSRVPAGRYKFVPQYYRALNEIYFELVEPPKMLFKLNNKFYKFTTVMEELPNNPPTAKDFTDYGSISISKEMIQYLDGYQIVWYLPGIVNNTPPSLVINGVYNVLEVMTYINNVVIMEYTTVYGGTTVRNIVPNNTLYVGDNPFKIVTRLLDGQIFESIYTIVKENDYRTLPKRTFLPHDGGYNCNNIVLDGVAKVIK